MVSGSNNSRFQNLAQLNNGPLLHARRRTAHHIQVFQVKNVFAQIIFAKKVPKPNFWTGGMVLGLIVSMQD